MMEGNTRLKRKRLNKNRKKAWRKHTDIKDVEEALEDERLQQRTGGLAAEKTDQSLFFVDKTTEEDTVIHNRGLGSLRCYANLEPDPQTLAILIPRKPGKRKLKKKELVTGKKTKRALLSEAQRQNAIKERELKTKLKNSIPVISCDLWSGDIEEDPLTRFHRQYTKKHPIQPPKHYREKTSELEAVNIPHPGASYNPTFEDHQDLLSKALQVEVDKERKEKFIEKSLDAKFPTKQNAPSQETWIKEMSEGLANEKSDSEEENDGDNDRLSVNPAVRRENKKTHQQKRKQKERKAEEKNRLVKKETKQRTQELFRLKSIKADVKATEKIWQDRKERKEMLREKYKNKPKKLGKLKFEEAEIEIKLSDELTSSLRELKPEGHLLEDRFKAFQRRNMIETRQRTKIKRKYRPKKFEKKSHKAVTI